MHEDDLEFAWQWMELAKQIYEKQVDGGDESKREKLSECFLTLGDIQLENEQFDEACRDYALALKLKVELQKPDDRQIFEAHFKYGLALENCNRLSDAIGEMVSPKPLPTRLADSKPQFRKRLWRVYDYALKT